MEDEAITATADMTDVVSAQSEPATETPSLDFKSYSESLSEPHRELLTKNGVDSFEAQEKWISNLNSMVGKKGLIAPDENATPEERQAYRDQLLNQLGRPEDGGYNFDLPEGAKEEIYSDEVVNKLATFAHKHGLNEEGYQEAINMLNEFMTPLLTEWEGTIQKINERLGEDKMDDKASSTGTVNRDTLREQGRMKMAEASRLWNDGAFKEAEQLQKEAKELYSQYASM